MKTNAARALDSLGISYELREYAVDPDDLAAESVAIKIGMPPEQVFKTLVVRAVTVQASSSPSSRAISNSTSGRWRA